MDCIDCKGLKRIHQSSKIPCINSTSCPECLPCKGCCENLSSSHSPTKNPLSLNECPDSSDILQDSGNIPSNDKLNRSQSQSISKREKMSDFLKKNLAHYQSLEALSTRAMAKTRRQEFETLKIKTKLSNEEKKSPDNKNVSNESPTHRSKASSCSDLDVNGLKSADSSQCLSSASVNRYAEKKEKMIMSSGALYSSKADLSASSLSSYFEDYDIPAKFKDWIPILDSDSKSKTKKLLKTKITDSPISIKSLLGHATQKALDLLIDRIVWWGAHYEELKNLNHWKSSQKITLLKLDHLSPTKDISNNEMVYRVLDIFNGNFIFY